MGLIRRVVASILAASALALLAAPARADQFYDVTLNGQVVHVLAPSAPDICPYCHFHGGAYYTTNPNVPAGSMPSIPNLPDLPPQCGYGEARISQTFTFARGNGHPVFAGPPTSVAGLRELVNPSGLNASPEQGKAAVAARQTSQAKAVTTAVRTVVEDLVGGTQDGANTDGKEPGGEETADDGGKGGEALTQELGSEVKVAVDESDPAVDDVIDGVFEFCDDDCWH